MFKASNYQVTGYWNFRWNSFCDGVPKCEQCIITSIKASHKSEFQAPKISDIFLNLKFFVQKKKRYYPAKCLDDLDIEKQFLFHNHNKKKHL